MAKNKGKEKFIREATLFHGDKYDYSKVEYKGYKEDVCIVCKKCGNVFWQSPKNHLRNNGCRICSKAYIGRTKSIHNTAEFIKRPKKFTEINTIILKLIILVQKLKFVLFVLFMGHFYRGQYPT